MNEHQSKRSLLLRLTSENVIAEEDEEALSSALGGTTRLVPRKYNSRSGWSAESQTSWGQVSLSTGSSHSVDSTTALPNPLSQTERDSSPTEWQNTWGQVSQSVGHNYSIYPTSPANPQWSAVMNGSAANWYNAQPIQFHDPNPTPVSHQHPYQHHQQSSYLSVDVTTGNAFSSFGQTSSALSEAKSLYDHSPQQTTPPQNNAHAHWQDLFVEMGANYS